MSDEPIDPVMVQLAREATTGCEESRLALTRRAMMGVTAGLFTWAAQPREALAATGAEPRLLVVILRGGVDGLSTVVPHGDPAYAAMRGAFALGRADTLALDSFFGLHPALPSLAAMYRAGEASFIHATCVPLRNRSHFDTQDNLENGLPGLKAGATGWLNRLLTILPAGDPVRARGAIEIGEAPLILRGTAPVLGWSPTWFEHADAATTAALRALYARSDKILLDTLDRGLKADKLAEGIADEGDVDPLTKAFRGAGRLLARADGPRIAVLSVGEFDTHSQQGLLTGQLATRLGVLDSGLADFRQLAGDAWNDTVVLCVTEFGRTVRANGDSGTDHGVGTMAILCGGAVAGGRIHADWPGLAANALYEASDLKPTTDLRAVFKGVLAAHLDVPRKLLDDVVFPGSAAIAPYPGLLAARSRSSRARRASFDLAATAALRPESAIARYRKGLT